MILSTLPRSTHMGRWACFALLLALPIAAGCGPAQSANAPGNQASGPAANVEVATATLRPWPKTVSVLGQLVADEESVVGAKVAGRIREPIAPRPEFLALGARGAEAGLIPALPLAIALQGQMAWWCQTRVNEPFRVQHGWFVKRGQLLAMGVDRGFRVREGDVLAMLEPEDFDVEVRIGELQVSQIRAELGLKPADAEDKLDPRKSPPVRQMQALLDEARLKMELIQSLSRQGGVPREDMLRHEAALNVAEQVYAAELNRVEGKIQQLIRSRAELARAAQRRNDAVVRAPFDGMVQERHVAPGVYRMVGNPIVTLLRIDPLRFRGGVPEREAILVQPGQEVRILLDGETAPRIARVDRVPPGQDQESHALVFEADVPNPGRRIRAGAFAQAEVIVDAKANALAVPAASISEFAGVEKVWVVADGKAREQRIATGRRDGKFVEVLEGLKPGDRIIADAVKGRTGPVNVANP